MASKLTPKQFNIYPATNRIKAEVMLENVALDNFADSTIVRNALYLVRHADVSCRLNGEASIALRNLSGYQFAKLVIGMANNSVMGSDVCAYIYNFLGMNEAPDPVQPAPVVTKRNLSFQEASDLLAENPTRTDVKLHYASRDRVVTKCEWTVVGFWSVVADMRYSYDQKGIVDFLWQEVTNTPAAPDSELDSEPLPVFAENATAEDYEPRKRVAGEIVDMWGVHFRVRDNGTFEQLPPRPKCDLCGKPNGTPREYRGHVVMIACEDCMPSADTVDPQPISRVQWGKTMDDLPMPVFENALHRATFMTWRDRVNVVSSPLNAPNFNLDGNKVLHAVRPSNMAKGGNKAFTPQSQTSKRIARKRKQVLREIRREQASKVIPLVQPEVLEQAA